MMNETCRWTEWATMLGEPTNNWDTECNHTFAITEGGPKENNMLFCCFCGKAIDPRPCVEAEDDTANTVRTGHGTAAGPGYGSATCSQSESKGK